MVVDERNMLDHILSREDAYKALVEWIPNARTQYASNRNYDIDKNTTSRLSPFISSGLLSEEDIIQCANNIGIPSKNTVSEPVSVCICSWISMTRIMRFPKK